MALAENALLLGQHSRPLAFAGHCVLRSSLLKDKLALVVIRRIVLSGVSVGHSESTGLPKIARMFFSRMGGTGSISPMNVTALIAVRPNPSVEARPNGRPPGPAGRYGVHFLPAGPGVLPLVPPHLKR